MARLPERGTEDKGTVGHPGGTIPGGHHMVATAEAMAAVVARCTDVLGHQDSRGQHSQGHRGLHPRGAEPETGHGAELAHLAETPQGQDCGG